LHAYPLRTQHGTFQPKVIHLVENVDHPHLDRKLQPVEDRWRRCQADMFRAQIAVPLDHQSHSVACADFGRVVVDECGPRVNYGAIEPVAQMRAHVIQIAYVDRAFAPQMPQIEAGIWAVCLPVSVKGDQAIGDRGYLGGRH
jgi:hypothetical protein